MASPDKTLVEIVTELVKAEVAKTLDYLKVDTVKEARKAAKARGQKFWTLVPGAEERAVTKVVDLISKTATGLLTLQIETGSSGLADLRLTTGKDRNPDLIPVILKALEALGITTRPHRWFRGEHECLLPDQLPEVENKMIAMVPEVAGKLIPVAESVVAVAKFAHDKSTAQLNAANYRLSLLKAAAKNAPKRPRQD